MKSLTKSAAAITSLMLVSKALGFLREICLAYKFGTSYIVDAYTACVALPTVIFAVYAYGFSESYIPVYMRIKDEQARKNFFSGVMTLLLAASLVIAALCYVFSGHLADILAPGFDGESLALLISFIQVIAFIFPFMTAFSLLSAHVQTNEDFVFPSFCDFIVVNLIVIISILLASEQQPSILTFGYTAAWAAAAALLAVYAAKKNGVRYKPRLAVRDTHVASLCKLAIPLGASRLVNELNGVADRMFASMLGEGVTSALSYANRVQLLFYTLTTSVLLSVCYPRVNRHFAEGNREKGMYYIKKAFMMALYISIPVMGGLFLFATPVVALLFQRGQFSTDSTAMTAGCLAFYALGIPFYALREIGSRVLAANTEQRRILKNTVFSVIFNISLNLLLFRTLGHIGLALATSLAGLLSSVLIFIDLHKLGFSMFERAQIPEGLKIAVASALSLLLCAAAFQWLSGMLGSSMAIILAAVLAAFVYIALSILLRIDIFIWLYQHLPAKLQILPR